MYHWILTVVVLIALSACQAPADNAVNEFGYVKQDKSSVGYELYQTHCAQCHDTGVAKAPSHNMLRFLSFSTVFRALTDGAMKIQGLALSEAEKQSVTEYLTGQKTAATNLLPPAPDCSTERVISHPSDQVSARNWGLTWGNKREISNTETTLRTHNVDDLSIKWAFAFPDSQRARSHPLLAGGALFVGSQDGTVYAIDQDSGCIHWRFVTGSEVRTGIVTSAWDEPSPTLYFGDFLGNVYAIDALTGKQRWRAHPDEHPAATITATPTYFEGRLYVAISSLEVISAAADDYECCSFRGSVVALDGQTGAQQWQTFSIADEPSLQGTSAAGTNNHGPSGAPIWNSPAIDTKRRILYVGTGENYSSPASKASDAVLAMSLDTGELKWRYQATHNDAWNSACTRERGHNCPTEDGPDFDFGAAMVLAKASNGQDILLGPQKSGAVHALNPDNGELIWKTRVGRGGLHGGIHFGIAVSRDRVFVPISDAPDGRDYPKPANPGLFALNLLTGDYLWRQPLADECRGRKFCAVGIGAAITATPELVFAGALDGYLRIHDAATGALIRKIETTNEIVTINGTTAHGGSMDGGAGPLPYQDRLYVTSGYNFAGHMPGNLLLVYELRE